MNNLMTSSLLELQKQAIKELEAALGEEDVLEVETRNPEENLRSFLEEAWLVKEEMAKIRELLALLEAVNDESRLADKQDVSRPMHDRINSQISEAVNAARRIRERLQDMDANGRVSGCREVTTVDRARSSVTNGLRKKLKELMMNFEGLRQRMVAHYRKEVGRGYSTLRQVPSQDVVDSDGNSQMQTLSEIQQRQDAAKEVEKSFLELHQVFLDMSLLVDVQGEMMDNIEYNVSRAADYIKGGTEELNSAKIYQRNCKWF
ncbi:syntaxin-related protein KNOLLE-like [Phalaenopsis equestris]|uniref:syntaxin-related protein KNOLLE-like n=1 Tax=Phalaenopsis equestris TaxID=78828 RepID=UPI0009E1C844|nr:syntaxin-related protein KNOLLE-like [Phalaenopsis equestris]XP_020598694.1 syntaxin-related protein KNOLLE-like [Phalaenopsis equestris]